LKHVCGEEKGRTKKKKKEKKFFLYFFPGLGGISNSKAKQIFDCACVRGNLVQLNF
jgi:hypothetical protein